MGKSTRRRAPRQPRPRSLMSSVASTSLSTCTQRQTFQGGTMRRRLQLWRHPQILSVRKLPLVIWAQSIVQREVHRWRTTKMQPALVWKSTLSRTEYANLKNRDLLLVAMHASEVRTPRRKRKIGMSRMTQKRAIRNEGEWEEHVGLSWVTQARQHPARIACMVRSHVMTHPSKLKGQRRHSRRPQEVWISLAERIGLPQRSTEPLTSQRWLLSVNR